MSKGKVLAVWRDGETCISLTKDYYDNELVVSVFKGVGVVAQFLVSGEHVNNTDPSPGYKLTDSKTNESVYVKCMTVSGKIYNEGDEDFEFTVYDQARWDKTAPNTWVAVSEEGEELGTYIYAPDTKCLHLQ